MLEKNSLKVIISSPSGAGKTTITKSLLKKIKGSYLSVSCTTREPRPGEKNGKDYFFISKKKFFNLKKKNKFLETAKVYGNFYGTLKSELSKKNKNIILLDIDWQGARLLRKKIKKNCYSFYLLPPSIGELKKRLLKRHQKNKNAALKRFSSAKQDIKHWTEYDTVYINDNLKKCTNLIKSKIENLNKEKKFKIFLRKFVKKF